MTDILEKMAAAKMKFGFRCEMGIFLDAFLIDGEEVIHSGQNVLIADAEPNGDESAEDVAGYCDVYNEAGERIVQGAWLDFDGLYEAASGEKGLA